MLRAVVMLRLCTASAGGKRAEPALGEQAQGEQDF
jgi:hypothetical protein